MSPPTFAWTGDLDDDCVCRSVPGYVCHAECMSDGNDPDDPSDFEYWYCSVGREPRTGDWKADTVFHSTENDVIPKTGEAARFLCEMAVLADLYRRRT